MPLRRSATGVPSGLSSILLPGETLVVAVHKHWARLAEPAASAAAAFVVALFIDSNVTSSTQIVGDVAWIGFAVVLVRLLWELLQWRHTWFVATDKRLLLRYGLITHKVAMMPLTKVTDMSYERPIPGQIVGYGRFIMESAGQDQALRVINWVPNPDETYRAICAEIFHIEPPGRVFDDGATDPPGPNEGDLDDEGDPGDPGDHRRQGRDAERSPDQGNLSPISRGPGPPESLTADSGHPSARQRRGPVQDRFDSYSRPMPVARDEQGESIYESEDIRQRRRGADTGPLPLWPPD